jgi:hypothetical protein
MTSKIKVDNINKVSDDSNIIKKCGTTTTIGSGASNPIVVDGSAVTLGRCGGTVALASGATQTGFGRTGTVDWQTTPKTGDFTAVNGEGYFVNTTSGGITMTMPSGSAGAIVSIQDYNKTFDSNALTITPASGEIINGGTADRNLQLITEGQGLTFVYVDSTVGWKTVYENDFTQGGAAFIIATGGNAVVTCGDFKTHIFTGPGTFCVSATAVTAACNTVDYLVVAGGGAGAASSSGSGGGAGGFRMSNDLCMAAPTTSPLANPTGITVTATSFPITVGAGGTYTTSPTQAGVSGSNTIFSTITSAGGGGGINQPNRVGVAGGSGSGGKGATSQSSGQYAGGAGNTPPVSPPQGNTGGSGYDGVTLNTQGGGGGGAGAVGGNASAGSGAPGGAGSYIDDDFVGPTSSSYGTTGPVTNARYFAGGGGGATDTPTSNTYPGGDGGGGKGGGPSTPTAERTGDTNTGGGGGAGGGNYGNGGSGIVMIRYKFQ